MHKAFQGDDGTWGVEEGGATLYEPMFSRATAEAIAEMEDAENPPKDWGGTRDRLDKMGLPY